MGEEEYLAYLESAKSQLKDAERAFKDKSYAENATSALILFLGAKPSKKHRNSLVLTKLHGVVSSDVRRILSDIIKGLKRLEPHVTKSRYPVRKGSTLIPPALYYTKEMAERALKDSTTSLQLVVKVIR